MATQKPLREMIPDILAHIEQYSEYLQFNLRLYHLIEGQVKEEVENSLRKEILSASAYKRAIQRIPPINILRKSTEKLSKVYIEPPVRLSDNNTDRDIMHNIARIGRLNTQMQVANFMYNAQNCVALEPYLEGNQQRFRVLAAHQFLPYSDDPSNPNRMTVGIKLLGQETQEFLPQVDRNGLVTQKVEIREITIFALYSDDEFLIVDSGGNVRDDKMQEMGVESDRNPFGKIPIVYKSKSKLQLIPSPNQEGFDVSILIPKLLTDLNYASQFMTHSIIWTKNADLSGQEINPDAIVDLGDSSADDGDPEIGVIDPKVDIPNSISLIEYELQNYFSSVGIKTQSSGMLSNGRDASGIAKAIDEGDTTATRKMQIEVFREMETELWDVMKAMQDRWASRGNLKENRKFSMNFTDSFRIKYAEVRPFKTDKQMLEEIQLWREQKLMTRKQAIRQLRPDFTDKQIDDWVKELDDEMDENLERMFEGLPTTGPERGSNGTFLEGNQVAQDQPADESSESET